MHFHLKVQLTIVMLCNVLYSTCSLPASPLRDTPGLFSHVNQEYIHSRNIPNSNNFAAQYNSHTLSIALVMKLCNPYPNIFNFFRTQKLPKFPLPEHSPPRTISAPVSICPALPSSRQRIHVDPWASPRAHREISSPPNKTKITSVSIYLNS